MSRYVSFALLLCVIVLLGFVFFKVMVGFIIPLFLAALMVVIFRPMHVWVIEKFRPEKGQMTPFRLQAASLATTLSILLAVLVPIALLFLMAIGEAQVTLRSNNATMVLQKVKEARNSLGLELPAGDAIRDVDERFDELLNTMSVDDLGFHQSALMYVADGKEAIEAAYNLGDPDAVAPEGGRQANWNQFVESLAEVRALNQDHALMGPRNEETAEKFHEYEIRVLELSKQFRGLKEDLLGGRIVGSFKELLNPSEAQLANYGERLRLFASEKLLKVGSASTAFLFSFFFGAIIMVLGIYFFLLDGPAMIESIKGLSPLDDYHEQELIDEFARVSRAVVLATLLSALAQGLLAGIGFYIFGLESIFLLTLLTCCFALVPFFGAAAVWVPAAIFLWLIEGEMTAAIGLAVYGGLIVSMADNVIKPLILHGQSNLHPLVALLSVLGGVSALGPIGILIGPMVVAFLQTLLKILQRELAHLDLTHQRPTNHGGDAAATTVAPTTD